MAESDGLARQWLWSAAVSEANDEAESVESRDLAHRKRLAMILRYIATMHHSNDASNGISFVNETLENQSPPGVLRHDDVLFATEDFRHILSIDHDGTLFKHSPFCFYKAAASPSSSRKRSFAGTVKRGLLSSEAETTRPCWLRITRLASEAAPRTTPAIREYLKHWQTSSGMDVRNLLRLDKIKDAPKVATGFHSGEIKSFLRQYKKYLRRAAMRTSLEPLYNRIFEWLQGGQGELVWGMGTATMQADSITIQGPLLEVLVEVDLSRDGALLIRPRQHTGVALNREVVAALTTGHDVLSNLHRTVGELETDHISPGEPSTYSPLLKRMAHELSSGGKFVSVSNPPARNRDLSKLIVTDAWCLYHRPKPSTVWARDASALAEQVLVQRGTLPVAAWSLTHGPAILASLQKGNEDSTAVSIPFWHSIKSFVLGDDDPVVPTSFQRPLLPLPISESQNRIADLLLTQNYPAIVCEGPPGSGKTHTIANTVCAYLCQGKRVLVTSKGAPALSVLRERLPICVQELCVDVSMSESTGMRQLQQTVERLADRVSCISTDVEEERCQLIKRTIRELETELDDIDAQLLDNAERKRKIIQDTHGQQLVELAFELLNSAPWLAHTISKWTVADTTDLLKRTKSLCLEEDDLIETVSGYESPPSDGLLSLVASRAGKTFSAGAVKDAASRIVASIPILGSASITYRGHLSQKCAAIQIEGKAPESKADWALVLRALELDKGVCDLHEESLKKLIVRESWPPEDVYDTSRDHRRIRRCLVGLLEKATTLQELELQCDAPDEMAFSIAARQLDSRRSNISPKLQHLAEVLVEATVVAQLSRMFSPDAQSALIRFAQIAGKAKFSKSSQASKMTQRQRRHRQEYLDAFEKCVRYIPCWILTSSQISDYLPAEFGLFDLVIIDEASQSDVTALPGMLRGKQWLIVGDGKQVSPSESFLSETQIDSLKAVLPESPFKESLLPGRSFFDLCAQAFPRGRVVLREHFRCAPEIIGFSNTIFYNGQLVPLRLPTNSERLTPSLIDIRVNGSKVGKINEAECDAIVGMIRDFVTKSDSETFPRSIGVISLVGDEQSRLIRGRLLDSIGPQKYKEHGILIGDASTFQGAEKDVVFLSMVCSPGRVPTQSQLMYAQRANVALSRARDRMVLVRSIDSSHVPSGDDIKIPILEFFAESAAKNVGDEDTVDGPTLKDGGLFSFRLQGQSMLEGLLRDKGYSVRRMGVVWNDAVCVEDTQSGTRAAISFECVGESTNEWIRLVKQQKSIERVGWKTFRVDGMSFLVNCLGTFKCVEKFLQDTGVGPAAEEAEEMEVEQLGAPDDEVDDVAAEPLVPQAEEDIVVISSSDDEHAGSESGKVTKISSSMVEAEEDAGVDPAQFGDLANLEFLRGSRDLDDVRCVMDDPYHPGDNRSRSRNGGRSEVANLDSGDDADHDDDEVPQRGIPGQGATQARIIQNRGGAETVNLNSDGEGGNGQRMNHGVAVGVARAPSDEYRGDSSDEGDLGHPRRRRRARLSKYSRDGRWYPGRKREEDEEKEWYDTDSDLHNSKPAARDPPGYPDATAESDDESPL